MRVYSEDDILDEKIRKKIIDEIRATENVKRKQEYLKRYEVYKDMTSKYVIQQLLGEKLHPETVALMSNRAANVSICRKVVNKLARTYAGGVSRTTGDDESEQQLQYAMRLLDWDDRMKKSDRYRELHKNCAIQLVPNKTSDDLERKSLVMRILNPWNYDVVEDPYDREKPLAFVISDFVDRYINRSENARTEDQAGYHDKAFSASNYTNRKDDVIADDPSDSGMDEKLRFIWWSKSYHFTTDGKGSILAEESPEANQNPIGRLPLVVNAEEQDGQFWAEGGSDLVDGSILINMLLTDMFSVQRMQGWGITVVKGKNLPEKLSIGHNQAIMLEYDEEDPVPDVSVVSQQPQIDAWMKSIEQYVALLLTTNNLSPANISVTLDTKTFPSGIAMLVEMSEATNDVENKQKDYVKIERELIEILSAWLEVGQKELTGEWAQIGTFPEDMDVSVKFNEIKPVITEKDKLEIIKLRKDLGIDSDLDLIMRDNPDMTPDEALNKLMRVKGEAVLNMFLAMKKGGHVHRLPDGTISGPDIPAENGKHFHLGLEPSKDSANHRHAVIGAADQKTMGPIILQTQEPENPEDDPLEEQNDEEEIEDGSEDSVPV